MNVQYLFKNDGEEIPYYRFLYRNDFKQVLKVSGVRNYWFKDGTYLPEFIKEETLKQHDFSDNYPAFDKTMILFIHWFEDLKRRDIDNYSYKPFIDVIRKLRIVEDDSWKEVSVTTIGLLAKEGDEESVEMHVIPFEYFPDYLKVKYASLFNSNNYKEKSMQHNTQKIDEFKEIQKKYNLTSGEEFFK